MEALSSMRVDGILSTLAATKVGSLSNTRCSSSESVNTNKGNVDEWRVLLFPVKSRYGEWRVGVGEGGGGGGERSIY